jgi:hypothetical protein
MVSGAVHNRPDGKTIGMDANREKNRARHSLERRAVIWQVATLLNIAILLVTVTVAFFTWSSVARGRSDGRWTAANQFGAPRTGFNARHNSESLPLNIAEARVDDFGTVAPAEFYEVLLRATPQELAGLASRFNELPNNSRTMAAVGMFFQAWAELDGKSALAGAFQMRDVGVRRMAANTVVHSASPSISPDLAAYVVAYSGKDFTDDNRYDLLDSIVSRWADLDPAAAANFLETIPETAGEMRNNTGSNIAFSWGTLDPDAALQWVQRQTSNPEILFNSVVNGWSKSDSDAAGTYVIQHIDQPGAFEAASSVALAMLNEDPNKAARWLRELPSGEVKANAERALASSWAERDPLEAAQWAEGLELEDRVTAAGTIANLWKSRNWEEARAWLGTISGEFRDAAIAGALNFDYQGQISPAEALPLALSMMDRQNRNSVVQNVIQRWGSDQPQAAIDWIQSSPLSKEEKQDLLSLDVFKEQRPQRAERMRARH